ncbi:MAG: glycosyltransferase, partial [Lachnospiraceae bacterium]|nr:glycosyltransferase [Lachnospiraceae bacterium]
MSIKSLVKKALIAVQNRKYQKALAARRMSYAHWLEKQADVQEDTSLSLEDYVVFQGCPGTPAKGWCRMLSAYLTEHPECLLVYGDEDVEGATGVYENPYFKPDWSPDLLKQWFYMGGLTAVHRSLIEDIEPALSGKAFLEMSDGMAYEELIREAAVRAGGYEKSMGRSIGHVPKVLFHRQVPWPEFAAIQSRTGQEESLAGHLLSIVIPSKDHPDLLDTCLGAMVKWEKELAYQVIIVDNGSTLENRQRCQELIDRYQPLGIHIHYLYEPMEFNFSRMCNIGARKAEGDLLLFLNDDVEPACENAFKAMAERALQPHTGAVGMKLYYPGGKRIQHCGITNLPMGPVHKLQFLEDDRDYYMGSNLLDRNVLAVTAACLMVTKEKFLDA